MNASIQFLLENGGPVIRYRTLKELCDDADSGQTEEAFQAVLAFPETQKRLERLKTQNIFAVHGGVYEIFETSLPLVVDFGITKSSGVLDQYMNLSDMIRAYNTEIQDYMQKVYTKTYIYPHFLRAGFRDEDLIDFCVNRIDTVYSFIKDFDYEIYDNSPKPKSLSPSFQRAKRLKKELYNNKTHDFSLPQIYDIVAMAGVYEDIGREMKEKIDAIVHYVVSAAYNQTVEFNYGILRVNGRYKAVGWDCLLPSFADIPDVSLYALTLQRMEIFSHFSRIADNTWFKHNLEFLEGFRTDDGTYLLPEEYLKENNHHWLLGNHMGLGENRKKQEKWRELESTFWILKLKKNAGLSD